MVVDRIKSKMPFVWEYKDKWYAVDNTTAREVLNNALLRVAVDKFKMCSDENVSELAFIFNDIIGRTKDHISRKDSDTTIVSITDDIFKDIESADYEMLSNQIDRYSWVFSFKEIVF